MAKAILTISVAVLACSIFLTGCGRYELTEKRHTLLKGKVLDSAGTPVADAGVLVRTQATGSAPRVWEGVTDKNGDYKVEVEWYRFVNYYLLITSTLRTGAPLSGSDYDLQITAWEYQSEKILNELRIPFAPVGANSISGTVLLQSAGGASYTPLANVAVTIDAAHQATTSAGGAFIISGLPDAAYTLTPALEGYTFEPASVEQVVPPDAIVTFIAHPVPPG